LENVSSSATTMPPAQAAETGGEGDAALTSAMESIMFSILAPQISELFGASSPK